MPIDPLEELESPTNGRGVEAENQRPDLMWMLGLVTPNRPISGPGPLRLTRSWALYPFLTLKPEHPFVDHQPTFSPQQALSHPSAPADALGCDLAEASAQFGLFGIELLPAKAVGSSLLAHHKVGKPLRNTEPTGGAEPQQSWGPPVGPEVSLGLLKHGFSTSPRPTAFLVMRSSSPAVSAVWPPLPIHRGRAGASGGRSLERLQVLDWHLRRSSFGLAAAQRFGVCELPARVSGEFFLWRSSRPSLVA